MKNYLGIDIGGTKMYMLYQSEDGRLIEKQVPTGKNATVSYVREEITHFIAELEKKPEAVAIAAPGLIENDRIIISDVLPNFTNTCGADLVPEYECFIINDVRAATVFETSKMAATDTGIVVMVGTGIACGLFSNGSIITGNNGFAGELGSVRLLNTVGEAKTLDELSSGSAIIKVADISISEILQKVETDDPKISEIIANSSFYLGLAISNLISVFNPNIVVFGGSTITYKGYFENMVKTVKSLTMPELLEDCEIRITSNLKNIVALGAILHAEQIKANSTPEHLLNN